MNLLRMYFCIYGIISIVRKKKTGAEYRIDKRSYCLKFSMKWKILQITYDFLLSAEERNGYLLFHSKASIIPTYSSVITRLRRENCFIGPTHVRFLCIF